MSKKKLLLLHGAMGSFEVMKMAGNLLGNDFEIHYYDFPGHGGKPFAEHPITLPILSQHLNDHIREFHLSGCHVFGYSLGGYTALWLEAEKPGTFASIMTLGTKFNWTAEVAERESRLIEPFFLEEKAPSFCAAMAKRHAPNDWKKLCAELQHMMQHLGRHAMSPDVLAQVSCPVRIAVGDRDQMVSVAESEHTYKAFGTASLLVMPATPHLFEKVNHDYLATEIKRFLS